MPREPLRRKFQQRGWRISARAKRARCPECIRIKAGGSPVPEKEEREKMKDSVAILQARNRVLQQVPVSKKGAVAASVTPRSTPGSGKREDSTPLKDGVGIGSLPDDYNERLKASVRLGNEDDVRRYGTPMTALTARQHRKLFSKLEEVFVVLDEDGGAGRYEDGWSDDRVASGVGVTPALVAFVREEAYGRIMGVSREDAAELGKELSRVGKVVDEAVSEVRKLEARIRKIEESVI